MKRQFNVSSTVLADRTNTMPSDKTKKPKVEISTTTRKKLIEFIPQDLLRRIFTYSVEIDFFDGKFPWKSLSQISLTSRKLRLESQSFMKNPSLATFSPAFIESYFMSARFGSDFFYRKALLSGIFDFLNSSKSNKVFSDLISTLISKFCSVTSLDSLVNLLTFVEKGMISTSRKKDNSTTNDDTFVSDASAILSYLFTLILNVNTRKQAPIDYVFRLIAEILKSQLATLDSVATDLLKKCAFGILTGPTDPSLPVQREDAAILLIRELIHLELVKLDLTEEKIVADYAIKRFNSPYSFLNFKQNILELLSFIVPKENNLENVIPLEDFLKQIHTCIAKDNVQYAAITVRRFIKPYSILLSHPNLKISSLATDIMLYYVAKSNELFPIIELEFFKCAHKRVISEYSSFDEARAERSVKIYDLFVGHPNSEISDLAIDMSLIVGGILPSEDL